MLTRLGHRAAARARLAPHTDVIGVVRTLLALAGLGTLLVNGTDVLFAPSAQGAAGPVCPGVSGLSLFCLAGSTGGLQVARWAGVVVLAVVASGWRPAWTAVPHWWIAWSVASSVTLSDGGDQVAASLALLLLPIALTDTRRWHWESPAGATTLGPARLRRRLVAHGSLWLVRLQVCGIYLHAAISKLGQPEWADGTALYYWLGNPVFGLPPGLRGVWEPILHSGLGVSALTWSVIVLELVLAAGLVADRRRRAPLLLAGIALHVGIVGMGLLSFAVVMCAALIAYLRPVEQPFGLVARGAAVRAWVRGHTIVPVRLHPRLRARDLSARAR